MSQSSFAPVFPGWNVWQVWQVKDLPFSLMMFGVSRDRQLRIWVEDELRLHSAAEVADPIDLKGSHIEIIAGPEGLKTAMRKENTPEPEMVVSGPAELCTLRFFNKGPQTQLAWPHDDSYMLDAVLEPATGNPATSGPPPTTIGQTVGGGIVTPITDALGNIPWYVYAGGVFVTAAILFPSSAVRKVKRSVRRIA